MTDLSGRAFLDLPRREAGYRPISERLKDFAPVEKPLTEAEIREQALRCMSCGTPFCHGAGCPLANVIPELNELAQRGRWEEAWALLTTTNPFPEWTGRLCPALCEAACVAGLQGEAVTIRQIERLIADKALEKGFFPVSPSRQRLRPRVAIMGSGPAGLAAAWRLQQAGVPVT
ncbi:MAG: glutamate synthase, partial [Planctomycetota bacterium]|nr:glutamate synthase [Planctomycetota bacterium]